MLSAILLSFATAVPSTPIYSIVSANSGLALDVINMSGSPGAQLQQWSYWGGNNQRWLLVPGTAGAFGLVNINSGMAVDVPNGDSRDGMLMQQWTWWNGSMQNWQLQPVGDGTFYLVNSGTGRCLEVGNYSKTPGGVVQQWTCVQQIQQRWKIVQLGDTGSGGGGFVQARGKQLLRNGQPLRLAGYNGALPGLPWCGWTPQQMQDSFSEITAHSGANSVRLWFYQAAGGPGNWGNFDAAIAAAKAQGLLVIPTLVNQWGDCEPNNSANVKNYKRVDWYQNGYKLTNDGYPLSFRNFAIAVAQHYANEPTVAFWQLVNEAEARDVDGGCANHSATAAALRGFADDMATALHQADPHHLVNLGTAAGDNWSCGVVGDDYNFVHAGAVDVCEVHSYDPANVALPAVAAQHISGCAALNKPMFMGEVGVCRNAQADGSCQGATTAQTLINRAQFVAAKWQAASAAGAIGLLLWDWSPDGSDTTFGVVPGDPAETQMSRFSSWP